jgi:hypothetical protein
MNTVAPHRITVKSETDGDIAVSKTDAGYVQVEAAGYSNRVVMELDDAILVARAILALAGEPADTEYEVWLEREYARQCAAGSLFPAELSEL